MERTLFLVYIGVLIYFLLGALVTWYIIRRLGLSEKRLSWIKYFTYFLIVALVLLAASLGGYFVIGLGIAIITGSVIEICRLYLKNRSGKHLVFWLSLLLLLVSSAAFLSFLSGEKNWIIYTYLLVMVSDASSQHSGQLFGKRKIFGRVSPNKTLEGLLGGFGMTLATSALLFSLIGINIYQSILLAFSISVFANLGDLLASMFKRRFGVKDFSGMIPGHGGILDRFDSFIVAGAWMFVLDLLPLSIP